MLKISDSSLVELVVVCVFFVLFLMLSKAQFLTNFKTFSTFQAKIAGSKVTKMDSTAQFLDQSLSDFHERRKINIWEGMQKMAAPNLSVSCTVPVLWVLTSFWLIYITLHLLGAIDIEEIFVTNQHIWNRHRITSESTKFIHELDGRFQQYIYPRNKWIKFVHPEEMSKTMYRWHFHYIFDLFHSVFHYYGLFFYYIMWHDVSHSIQNRKTDKYFASLTF